MNYIQLHQKTKPVIYGLLLFLLNRKLATIVTNFKLRISHINSLDNLDIQPHQIPNTTKKSNQTQKT
ncbi:hypothetical protein NEIMUCOT_04085 [Neisseria mucosa ATCC 25996]|uniref:Uncharacterized protein n=1 Tax=Neisseria mucosa (strain ATCC 25996 / DSM 4631 / NCTC 10774 / M26) TaxID=546266 RepID=D2ZTZ7_NEIM2|nr:hypothetical protein NEIMUCOT_04085 [Neisseria mucosa ATCC 25996]